MMLPRILSPSRRAHRRSAARAFAAVLALALAGACGGNTPVANPNGNATQTTPGASRSSSATSSSPHPGSTSTRPATSSPGTTPSVTPTATSTGGSSAALALSCARRDFDVQEITITTTPNGPAGYSTQYSDGSMAGDGQSDYRTGRGGAITGPDGTFHQTWKVPANAPTGRAIVYVTTAQGRIDLSFTVVAQDGACP